MPFRISIVGILLMGCLLSCGESTIAPDNSRLGLEYFPLETGQFRIYDAEEINYSILGSDTAYYQLRESVVDSFLNTENTLTYILHRESRANASAPWALDSVWTARRSSSTGVVTENNIPFIKLVFPLENGLTWDGNKLNKRQAELYTYDLDVPDTLLFENQFNSLVKVTHSDVPENVVNRDQRSEIYAPGVGMIIKNSIILAFCTQDCPVEKTIEAGRSIQLTLRSYGKE